ncbi:CDP-glycerol glycerophosphotransferase family protein [Enterococcus hulanensis]|uniref:CDP-glycerol glycerophosphotransferase family protein n=1 Tax=Enterococcus hulanensis TaxID=2559929 RepID=UPI00288EFC5D|nr:CDP-glycerol glycerophosphotransferase family protein [Enterococcus hulanensis]MDT2660056.1 CDP-glycerol glycerophosphotransferase family protein [Enterococcus hulanensis]
MTLKQILKKVLIKCVPIKKNRIVFSSFNGHYSDNPKYISESFHSLYPEIEIVWLLDDAHFEAAPSYVKKVKVDSFFSFIYEGSAIAIVDNVYGNRSVELINRKWSSKFKFNIISFFNKKKGQKIFTTWHGTPLKRMGRDQINTSIIDFDCPNTTMILGNQFTIDIMKHLSFGKIKMELIGTPRNDILFDHSVKRTDEIRKKLNLPSEKKIILFAPTFRTNSSSTLDRNIQRSGIEQLKSICLDQLFEVLSEKFGGDWVMVCRFHYHVEELVEWRRLNEKYSEKIINGNLFDDMSEYMYCSDILLTDASSCMFDFSLTQKPCFLFFPDVKHYESEERGFYMAIEELPFSLSKNSNELLDNIKTFDWLVYKSATAHICKKINVVDQANSSEKVTHFISSKIRN